MFNLKKYIQDSAKELNNVTWPTKNQAIRLSIIVISFTLVAALILGVLDQLFTEGYKMLLKM